MDIIEKLKEEIKRLNHEIYQLRHDLEEARILGERYQSQLKTLRERTVGQLQHDLSIERRRADDAEKRIAELEADLATSKRRVPRYPKRDAESELALSERINALYERVVALEIGKRGGKR
jgi:predicted RNase H-like nuclease (RuvC/YqgF family)